MLVRPSCFCAQKNHMRRSKLKRLESWKGSNSCHQSQIWSNIYIYNIYKHANALSGFYLDLGWVDYNPKFCMKPPPHHHNTKNNTTIIPSLRSRFHRPPGTHRKKGGIGYAILQCEDGEILKHVGFVDHERICQKIRLFFWNCVWLFRSLSWDFND